MKLFALNLQWLWSLAGNILYIFFSDQHIHFRGNIEEALGGQHLGFHPTWIAKEYCINLLFIKRKSFLNILFIEMIKFDIPRFFLLIILSVFILQRRNYVN